MSESIMKKYVDRDGLNLFLGKLKEAYASNTSTKFVVNHALEAGKLSTLRTFTFKNVDGTETFGTTTWDGSGDFSVNLNVSASSPVGPVEGALIFKGIVDGELPQGYSTFEAGDVLVCTGDYTHSDGTEFKAGSEYLYDGSNWVELGSVITPIDLSDYVTKTELVEDLADYETTAHAESTYATKTELGSYETSAHASSTYATKSELGDYETELHAEATYATKTELGNYVTETALNTALEGYYNKSAANQKFLNKEDAALTYSTKTELAEHKEEADATYVAKVDYVTDPEINKMFPVDYEGSTSQDFREAVSALGAGGALNIDTEVTTPTTDAYGMIIGNAAGTEPVDVTFNLGENGSLVASSDARVFTINPNSKVEINGGEVVCNSNTPAILVSNNSSLKIDGVTLEGKNYSVLQSNGLNENSDFTIKNCTIYGPNYMPACGNLVIEDSTFVASDNTSADAGPLYIKSGSVTIRNSHFTADANNHSGVSGKWRHWNNGWYGIATALVIENCNYGGHGNVSVDIDAASTFTAGYSETSGDSSKQFDNVGILIINYNGEQSESIKIAQDYYTININEASIEDHYFTLDGRSGASDQLTKVEYQA